MALVVRNIYTFFHKFLEENQDERIKDLLFANSPWPVFIILSAYFYFVNGKGQEWMKNRNPFELNSIMKVYNIIQVFFNLYMCIGVAHAVLSFGGATSFLCIPPARNLNNEYGDAIIYYSHLYYLNKILDLLDTIFFILRKKNNQVTFLHIYHHFIMVLGGYAYMKWMSGGGQATGLGIINAFVHVVMYAYYFLTSVSSEIKNSIWWKKYITQLQMTQFAVLIVHFLIPFFAGCEDFPRYLSAALAFQNVFMFILFGDFYYKAYIRVKSKQ